jgi:hypothetical protein
MEPPVNILPTTPTLQAVLDCIPHADKLPVRTRRELESAVHVFCRDLGRQPGDILVSQVEPLGRGLNAARMGVTRGRVNNIRSLVRRAVGATIAKPARRCLDFPLTADWEELAHLGRDKGERIILKRLFRILQVQGIQPAALTQAAFDRVRHYLHETGASRPDAIYRKMVISWNRLQSLLRPYRT